MKNTISTTLLMLWCAVTFGQINFRWEKIDSVAKSKSQIYSDTKMFIAETWKSSKSVIQNDDKENGAVFIEGTVEKIGGTGLRVATYWYS